MMEMGPSRPRLRLFDGNGWCNDSESRVPDEKEQRRKCHLGRNGNGNYNRSTNTKKASLLVSGSLNGKSFYFYFYMVVLQRYVLFFII
jgi:hypothetical protein